MTRFEHTLATYRAAQTEFPDLMERYTTLVGETDDCVEMVAIMRRGRK